MRLKKLFTSLAVAAATVCLAVVMSVSAAADYPSSTGQTDSTSGQDAGQGQDQGQGQQGGNQQPGSPSYSGSGSGGGAVIHFFYLPDSGAKGKMPDVTVSNNTYYTLPECTFTPPAGMGFAGWVTFDYISQPKEKYSVGTDKHYYLLATFSKEAVTNKIEYITVTFDNGLSGSNHQTYTQKIKNENYGKKSSEYKYEQIKLPEPRFKAVEGYEFDYWDTGGKPGKYIYYAKGTEKVTIKAKMKSVPIKVDLSTCTITVKQGKEPTDLSKATKADVDLYMNYVYRGTKITPIYEVKDKKGNILKEGVDFKATYSNNIEAGDKAKIKIEGINGNTGSKTKYFTILKMPFYELYHGKIADPLHPENYYTKNSSYKSKGYYLNIVFNGNKANYKDSSGNIDKSIEPFNVFVYTGKNITPDISYVFHTPDNDYILPVSNFYVQYMNNTRSKVGRYVVKINGKDFNVSYDTIQTYFSIIPPKQHIGGKIIKSGEYKGQIQVSFDALTADINEVQIEVSTDSTFANNNYDLYYVSGKGVSAKLLKWDKKWDNKTVYIKVRNIVKVNGSYYYGAWSSVMSIKKS